MLSNISNSINNTNFKGIVAVNKQVGKNLTGMVNNFRFNTDHLVDYYETKNGVKLELIDNKSVNIENVTVDDVDSAVMKSNQTGFSTLA